MINGIDVSEFQENINWSKVKAAGTRFAIIRAGFGSSITQKDESFDRNMKEALAAGIDVGAYWFSYAVSVENAKKEAKLFSEIMRPYRGKAKYPLYFDYEYSSYDYSVKQGITPTRRLITDIAKAFMDTLEDYGWFAGWYTNQDYYSNYYYSQELSPYTLWLAAYDVPPPFSCAIQQNSSTAKVDGISGYVDTDLAYVDFPSIIMSSGRNGFLKTNDEVSPPKENSVIKVTGQFVRIRKSPSTQSQILAAVDIGTSVEFLNDEKNGWSKIKFGSITGYMSNMYLSDKNLSKYKTAVNYGNYVNVRSAPSLSGKILKQINRGKKFSVISLWSDQWMNVLVDGIEGFIYYDKSYISL